MTFLRAGYDVYRQPGMTLFVSQILRLLTARYDVFDSQIWRICLSCQCVSLSLCISVSQFIYQWVASISALFF